MNKAPILQTVVVSSAPLFAGAPAKEQSQFTTNKELRFEGRPVAAALLLTFLVAGCAGLRTGNVEADSPEAKAQIEQRLEKIFVAAENKDFGRLDSYHLYGPKFTKFSGSSAERLDATAGRNGEHVGLGSLTGLKMRADSLKIDVFGEVAIATFMLNYSFESGADTIPRKERATMVFVEQNKDWKIAHEHLSPIKQ
jgi:hypothetical protein